MMHKFSIGQKTKRFWIVVSILIVGIIGVFSSTVIAQPFTTDTNFISGKDIPHVSFPLFVTNNATSSENTWGRVVRISSGNNSPIVPPYRDSRYFFDIGIDDQGNFFINSPVDTKTSHSVMISPDGVVTVNRPQL